MPSGKNAAIGSTGAAACLLFAGFPLLDDLEDSAQPEIAKTASQTIFHFIEQLFDYIIQKGRGVYGARECVLSPTPGF